MARLYVLANTPRSLYVALASCNGVLKMRRYSPVEGLIAYYDKITARAKRNEIVMGLAYGLLLGVLLNDDYEVVHGDSLDCTRLDWGCILRDMQEQDHPATQILTLSAERKPASGIIVCNEPSPGYVVFSNEGPEKAPGEER